MMILLAVAILALTTAGLTVYVVRAVVSYRIDQPVSARDQLDTEKRDQELALVSGRIDELVLAVDEGIRRVDRAENRIQKTVTSARRLVRESGLEHAGIEAEYAELQPPDEERVEALHALQADMDPTRTVRLPGGSLEIGTA